MKKVFFDTNILIDMLEDRRFSETSRAIVSKGEKGKFQMFASLLSFSNIAYIRRKQPTDVIYNDLQNLRKLFTVLEISGKQLDEALKIRIKDFEDNLQFQCAKSAGCDVIVSNNVKDFEGLQGVPVMSAEDFILDLFADEEA